MKLLSCNVQNFGTLSEFRIDFDDKLTVIKEENGFGKSTLAVFLKAMLYGLPQTSKRSLDENERKKYTPWQKGAFGGTLDIEVGGKKYRIERFFGDREKDDTFRLFDLVTGKLSTDYTENIGLELFGIDADSFERSVYLPQADTTAVMNNSLRAKLTGLVEDSDDISNYDNAVKALEKRGREYSVANGARGAIADKMREIEQLEADVRDGAAADDNLKRVERELEQLRKRMTALAEQKDILRKQITAASDAAARVEQAKRRAELTDSVARLTAETQAIMSRYPNGFPSGQELSDVRDTIELLRSAETELSMLEAETDDRDELKRLNLFFNVNVPNEQTIADRRADTARIAQLKARVEYLSSHLSETADVPKKGKGTVKILLTLSVLAVASGAVTCVWQAVVGIVLVALGLFAAGAAAFVHLKNMILNGKSKDDSANLRLEYDALLGEIADLSRKVSEFTEKYMPDAEPEAALDTIAQSLRDLKRLEQAVSERERKADSRRGCIAGCNDRLLLFFKKYGVGLDGAFSDRLTAVKRDADEFAGLSSELTAQQERLSALPPQEALVSHIETGDREALLTAEKKTEAELDETQRLVSVREAEAKRLSAEAEALPEIEERLEGLRQERDEMTEKYTVITKTLELLKKAKNDLSLRYLDRMTDGFKKYTAIIGGQVGEVLIDTDLTVRLDRHGAAREKEYFSTGIKDMMDIAMRLALSDALFDGESPMLILDDPFVNLDDGRVANSLEMLKKLAEQRQIIYLTCHSSRC